MDISREDLAGRFRSLSDDELLRRLDAGTLTPLAREVAEIELQSRGVEPPSRQESADESGEADGARLAAGGALVTVAEYWDPIQANLVRSLLESDGIAVHLWGEHLGIANNFLSVASGGMRVQVPGDQEAQAREIIAAFQRGDLAMEEEPE